MYIHNYLRISALQANVVKQIHKYLHLTLFLIYVHSWFFIVYNVSVAGQRPVPRSGSSVCYKLSDIDASRRFILRTAELYKYKSPVYTTKYYAFLNILYYYYYNHTQ